MYVFFIIWVDIAAHHCSWSQTDLSVSELWTKSPDVSFMKLPVFQMTVGLCVVLAVLCSSCLGLPFSSQPLAEGQRTPSAPSEGTSLGLQAPCLSHLTPDVLCLCAEQLSSRRTPTAWESPTSDTAARTPSWRLFLWMKRTQIPVRTSASCSRDSSPPEKVCERNPFVSFPNVDVLWGRREKHLEASALSTLVVF